MFKYRKIAVAACSIMVIAACISVQPVRAIISDALSIFRAENVKGISISLQDIQQIKAQLEGHEKEINMDKLGKIKNSGGERKNISEEEAKNITDIKVLYPAELSSNKPEISVLEPATMEFNMNVDNVNGVLKNFGAVKLLPKDIDGKTFSINTSKTISMFYRVGENNLNIIETKSPEIVVPSDVNVDEIYSSLTDLPILPSNLKQQLKSIKDWKNTLYIPITEGKYEEVDINGVKGYLSSNEAYVKANQNSSKKSSYSTLIWGSSGNIYTLQGTVDKDDMIKIARSMR